MLSLLLAALVLSGAFAAAAPEGESDGAITEPASPVARKISDLFWIITAIAVVVGIGVQGVIALVIIKGRKREKSASEEAHDEDAEHNDGQPQEGVFRPRHYGNVSFEKAAFAVTLAVFIGLGFMSWMALNEIEHPDRPVDIQVDITAQQWFWQFHYPQSQYNVTDVGTLAELHAPVGATVLLKITSKDVLHAAWIPELGVKIDAIPGTINTFWFRADREGTFLLQCAEYCAGAHSDMHAIVIIESQAEFASWVQAKQDAARPPPVIPQIEGGEFNITLASGGPQPPVVDIIDGVNVSFRVTNNLGTPSSLAFSGPYANATMAPLAPGATGWLNISFTTPVANGTYSCTGCAAAGEFHTKQGARIVDIHLRQTAGSHGMWSIFPEEVVAQPGEVLQFHVFNDAVPGQGTTHNFSVGIFGQEILLATEGIGAAASLQPGEDILSDRFVVPDSSKQYWCDVGGHYNLGMHGVLTVEGGTAPPPPPALPEENVPGFEGALVPLALLGAALVVAVRRRG